MTSIWKPLFAAAVLTAALAAQAHAQDATTLRMRLAGEFIGANQMVLALSGRCPGDYGDPASGARGALDKLKPIFSATEMAELNAYVASREYSAIAQDTNAKVQGAFDNLVAQTGSAAEACTILARDILATYAATKNALEEIR